MLPSTIKIAAIEGDRFFNNVLNQKLGQLSELYQSEGLQLQFKTYHSGKEFLEDAGNSTSNVIIVDNNSGLDAPSKSGEGGLEMICRQFPKSKVIMLTNASGSIMEFSLLKKRVYDFIVKDNNALIRFDSVMHQLLNERITQKRVFNETIALILFGGVLVGLLMFFLNIV